MWEIGGQKLWEVGDWGSKIVGGGRLGVKNCGRWEMGTPVSPPPSIVAHQSCISMHTISEYWVDIFCQLISSNNFASQQSSLKYNGGGDL